MDIKEAAALARKASTKLSSADSELKNNALSKIYDSLIKRKEEIFRANNEDIERSIQEGLPDPLIKRLKFDEHKLNDILSGIQSLISLEDPVGKLLSQTELDNGLDLYKVSCPIGVIGIIFESRPDALIQISTLCLKSGNAALLKGGREAIATNRILFDIVKSASEAAGIVEGWVHLLESRSDVTEMLKLDDYIDLIIPRGSNEFVKYIMDNSNIAVMGHADGICHCYIDSSADISMAVKVVADSKAQYVSVCNATETLLVNEDIALTVLPEIKKVLEEKQVELVGCDKTREIIDVPAATEQDWKTEYLDYKLSIKIVPDLMDAIEHINTYGSGHTDSIITSDKNNAEIFMNLVDSANVFWNCSTRFSDGFRYGFGAEVGVSTNKLHARGPVGLDGLQIYKYKLIGHGDIVADYANNIKTFKHKKIK